jgi:twitching motility protein PilI
MANRQALRDLQSRLAERLQAARSKGVTASWLAVEAGSLHFLFPLSQSGEIFPWVSAQAVPYTQAWFSGVANLRGGLFGVVDLASFVSGQPPVPRAERALADARLVALNAALDVNCALLIDRLAGLRKPDAFTEVMARSPDALEYFGHRYVDLQGTQWQEINLQLLARQTHFLTVGA